MYYYFLGGCLFSSCRTCWTNQWNSIHVTQKKKRISSHLPNRNQKAKGQPNQAGLIIWNRGNREILTTQTGNGQFWSFHCFTAEHFSLNILLTMLSLPWWGQSVILPYIHAEPRNPIKCQTTGRIQIFFLMSGLLFCAPFCELRHSSFSPLCPW